MVSKALSPQRIGAFAVALLALVPAAANAHPGGRDFGWNGPRGEERADYARGRYAPPDDERGRRDAGERHRCRGGSGGAILGAIAGGLLGNAVAGYGDRAAGTLVGGGVGAIAGDAIARNC